jgi:flagellar biosynthesis protein FliR
MNETLAQVLDISNGYLFLTFVVFLRVGAAMAMLPAFGEQSLPARVRLALGLCFTFVVMPAVAPSVQGIVAAGKILGPYLLSEVLIGLLLGIMLRLFILALQTAGAIIAQATSLSQMFGGTAGEPQPVVGHILVWGGLALAVMSGLHVKLAMLLIDSYQALPAGKFPGPELVRVWGLSGVVHTFSLSFSLSAPFVIASLVYNAAMGAINRAMPSLMVSMIGAPALTLGGLALMGIAVPSALVIWHGAFNAFLLNPFEVAP